MKGKVKKCRFCRTCLNSRAIKSREHVFPEWLGKALGSPPVECLRISNTTGESSSRTFGLDDFFVRDVCARCNSGWMSRLEKATLPLVTSLMTGLRRIDTLVSHEEMTIALWACKTASVLSKASQAIRGPSRDAMRMIARQETVPGQFHVFLHRVKGHKSLTCAVVTELSAFGTLPNSFRNSYISCFVVGELLFTVAYCSAREGVVSIDPATQWPIPRRPVSTYFADGDVDEWMKDLDLLKKQAGRIIFSAEQPAAHTRFELDGLQCVFGGLGIMNSDGQPR